MFGLMLVLWLVRLFQKIILNIIWIQNESEKRKMAKNTSDEIKKVLVDAAIDVTAKILKKIL